MLLVSQQTCLYVLKSAFLHSSTQRTSGKDYIATTDKRQAKLKACPYMQRLVELPRVVAQALPRVLPAVLPAVLPRVLLQQGPPQLPLFPPRQVLLRQGAEAALLPGAEAAGAPEVEAVSSPRLGVGQLARAPRNPQGHRLQRVPVAPPALHLPKQRQPRLQRAQHPLREVQVGICGLVSHMTLKSISRGGSSPCRSS